MGSLGNSQYVSRHSEHKRAYSIMKKLIDDVVGFPFETVEKKRDADCQTADNLFMLRLMGVLNHLVERLWRSGAEHHKPHPIAGCLASNCIVVE